MSDLIDVVLDSKFKLDLGQVYKQRSPKGSVLYQTVKENFPKFLVRLQQSDDPDTKAKLPIHIESEFFEYLKCGILEHGFIKMSCTECQDTLFVPLSCKRRGFCPSCIGKRMNEGSAFFTTNVIPTVPVRQWVLSFPMPARYWMARNPKLMGSLLNIYIRALNGYYQKSFFKRSGVLAKDHKVKTGSLTVIQRFGSALNLNVHFHTIFLDGVYVSNKDTAPVFVPHVPLQNGEVELVLKTVQKRMIRHLIKRGLISKYENDPNPDQNEEPNLFDSITGASVLGQIAIGENKGSKVRRVGSFGTLNESAFKSGPMGAVLAGFSLHAGTYIKADDRDRLETLCRYLLRPPVSEKRLKRLNNGDVLLQLKSEWSDGTRAMIFSPMEFIEKLIAIIPNPRIHQVRFHGILAPSATDRQKIVPAKRDEPIQGELFCPKKRPKPKRTSWAELLKRTFKIDLTTCQLCGGAVKFAGLVIKKSEILEVLSAAGLSPTPE